MPYAWYPLAYSLLWALTSPQRAVVRPSKKLCSWLPGPSWVIFVRFTRADTFHLVPIALSCPVTLVRAPQTFFNAPSRHKVEHVKSYQLALLSTINCIHGDWVYSSQRRHFTQFKWAILVYSQSWFSSSCESLMTIVFQARGAGHREVWRRQGSGTRPSWCALVNTSATTSLLVCDSTRHLRKKTLVPKSSGRQTIVDKRLANSKPWKHRINNWKRGETVKEAKTKDESNDSEINSSQVNNLILEATHLFASISIWFIEVKHSYPNQNGGWYC